ncbi:synaptic vesicle 2-related protein [Periophthalmus magnuspinnatus]|uniref:synaptic vesicle 2-related protein n=1 Tax=Periophthalmus magnuspinnatus TaxID=409849 RepID=UPI00145ABD48|nr:synaptic vesicle 2-related protein [Periophthalmus magnuspinnatus]
MDKLKNTVFYKKWNDSQVTEEVAVGHCDEDWATENEIYTRTESPTSTEPATICGARRNDIFTVDDALEAVGFGKYHWKICLFTGLSWIGDAMEMMILSILGPQLHCEWRLPGYKVALITSVVFIGMGIGSPLWGNVSDKYGRRRGLIACMMWTLYYGLLSSFAPQYSWIITLRALVGFGLGGAPQAVTLYSEFLPVKARGVCVMLIAAFWALGAVCEVVLALLVMPTLGWRWLLGLSVIPMAVFVLLSPWLPESPRFDVLTGRSDKAMKTLEQMAKANKKCLPQGRLICRSPQSSRGRVKDLFIPQHLRTTLILWFVWFSNAFCYYGIVLLTTEMFQDGDACGTTQGAKADLCRLECKYLTTEDYKDLLWTTLAEFPGILIVLFAIDRIGRKRSMTLGFFMFALCILPMYSCIGRISLTILIFVARAAISGGYQVVFVYTPEVFPTEIRALALGTSSGFARVGALVTPFVAQVLLRYSANVTLSVYWVCALLAGIAALLLPIETLGRTMQERGAEPEPEAERTSSSQ